MAQSGYTPILIYASGTATNVPLAANMTSSASGAELALNYADGKLYYKNSSGVVTLLASSTTVTNSFSAGTTGFTPSTATTGAVTLGGTLITSNGGTGLASYTAGDLSYYASGTALTKLAIGTAGQFLTSTGTAPQWSTLSGVAVTTFSAGTTGFTPNTATSGAITLAGTLATTNGGTGLTSFTSGGVVYASSSSALATGSALTFNGTSLGVGSSSYGDAGTITASIGVAGTTAGGLQLWASPTQEHYIQWGDSTTGSATYAGAISYDHASNFMRFWTSSTEQMRLNSTGLGIGESAPAWRLMARAASSGTVAVFAYDGAFAGTSEANIGLRFYNGGLASDIPQVKLRAYGTSNYTGNFAIDVMQGGTYPNPFIERFTIQGTNGYVGIGTNAPNSLLELSLAGASVTSTLALANYQGGADGYGSKISFRGQRGAPNAQVEYGYIQAIMNDWAGSPNMQMGIMGGNVGIGVTSPAYQLQIGGGTTVATRIQLNRGSDDTNQNLRLGWNAIKTTRTSNPLSTAQTNLDFVQVGSDAERVCFSMATNGSLEVNFGIKFPATQVASADANTLDDYEEGTWSPQLWSDANQGTSYTSQVGYYTKVGRLVTCWFGVQCTLVGGTYLRLYGLPYSVGTSGTGYQSVAYSNGSGGSTSAYIETYLGTGGQVFQGATGYLNPASFSGTFFGGVYQFYASA